MKCAFALVIVSAAYGLPGGLGASLTAAAAGPPASTSAAAGDEIVERYNRRPLGQPGWRRVRVELISAGGVAREFTVLNLWRVERGDVRALYFLEQPPALRGTAYLETESLAATTELSVHLFLPAGRRSVFQVSPRTFGEGLLGSDFAYEDVRLLSPRAGVRYRVVGEGRLLNRRVVVVEARRSGREQGTSEWRRALLHFDPEGPCLLGADYESARGMKTMRVEQMALMEGVRIPRRMRMTAADGRATLMTLDDHRFRVGPFPERWFTPEALPCLETTLAEHGLSAAAQAGRCASAS